MNIDDASGACQAGPTEFLHALCESATLAHDWSERYCDSRVYGGASCHWYHGLWQYLSRMGLVSTPWRESAFFLDTLSRLIRQGQATRVLISGASDYAMLSVLAESARLCGRPLPSVTAVDTCETPLKLQRWYSEKHGLDCATQRVDILSDRLPGSFDLVCTHSFLGNFDSAARTVLIRRWHDVLAPGGRVVTINRIRPGARGPSRFDEDQAVAFGERVRVAAEAMHDELELEPGVLAEHALEYARTYLSHPVCDVDELRRLFEDGGFKFERFELNEGSSRHGAPSTSDSGVRARLVARRAD